jgi:GNAT superfamily N-acetyltransferase
VTPALWLRTLTDRDMPAIEELLAADAGYAQRVTGGPPEPGGAAALLTDRPADLAPEQKMVLGAIDDEGLAAVIDVLLGWPDSSMALVGLLQVHAHRKRQGLGRRAHDLLLDWIAAWPEITTLRAIIVETNASAADPFWRAMGYRPTEPPRPYQAGATLTRATAWTRPTAPRPV